MTLPSGPSSTPSATVPLTEFVTNSSIFWVDEFASFGLKDTPPFAATS